MASRTITDADASRPDTAPATTAGAQGGAAAPGTVDPWAQLVKQYWPNLKRALPAHVNSEVWAGAVYGAMYRGRQPNKNLDLARAANRNPESLLFALFEAARLGHEPGSDFYYLTPRPNKNATSGVEVLGMEGYRGVIDRMYRAGAQSVHVREVRRGDTYRFEEDVDRIPFHRYDRFATAEERGEIRGAYAYAYLASGAPSHVVEITLDDIRRAKESSGTAKYADNTTFWNHWHDVIAMVRKTAVHQLEKWVTTSTERLTVVTTAGIEQARARQTAIAGPHAGKSLVDAVADAQGGGPAAVGGGDEMPAPPLDTTQFAQPPAPEDEAAAPAAAAAAGPSTDLVTEFPPVQGEGTDDLAKKPQTTAIRRMLRLPDADLLAVVSRVAGWTKPLPALEKLTEREAGRVIAVVGAWKDAGTFDAQVPAVLDAARSAGPDRSAQEPPAELPKPGTKAWHDAEHPRNVDGQLARVRVDLSGDCSICLEQAEETEAPAAAK